jgi:prolyl 4-hydroxylase
MESFIKTYSVDEDICDGLIQYHKKNKEYKNIGAYGGNIINKNVKDSTDVYFYNCSNNKYILKFFNSLSVNINKYLSEFNITYNVRTSDMNLIQHYPPNGGYKIFHYECTDLYTMKRKLVYMLYLNNVKNGGTEFKYQNIKLEAKKGNLIIWPADFTHTHKGIISKEEKYIATGWLEIE